MLTGKWTPMNTEVLKFNQLVQETAVHSGENDDDHMSRVYMLYDATLGGRRPVVDLESFTLLCVSRHESRSSMLKESEKASRAEETITQQNAKVSVLYDVNEPTVGSLNLAKLVTSSYNISSMIMDFGIDLCVSQGVAEEVNVGMFDVRNADVDVGIPGTGTVRISQNPNSDFGRVHGSADA
ncbi:hypothetical protein Tco_0222049, partial [Tanacetum coccineum]